MRSWVIAFTLSLASGCTYVIDRNLPPAPKLTDAWIGFRESSESRMRTTARIESPMSGRDSYGGYVGAGANERLAYWEYLGFWNGEDVYYVRVWRDEGGRPLFEGAFGYRGEGLVIWRDESSTLILAPGENAMSR